MRASRCSVGKDGGASQQAPKDPRGTEDAKSKESHPNKGARPVRHYIAHNHIFRNAGSTITWALRKCFGEAFFDFRRLMDLGVKGAHDVPRMLRGFPFLKAFEVHHYFFGTLRVEGYSVHNIVFLRNPIDRLRSTYDFVRAKPQGQKLGAVALATDLRGFIEYLLSIKPPIHVENPQTRIILGAMKRRPRPEDLEPVKDTLLGVEVLGLVERFDDCMVLAEAVLAPYFPGVDLAYVKQNAAPARKESLLERDLDFRSAVGEDIYAQIVAMNQLDFALVSAVEEEISRRISLLPNFEQCKRDFQARCRDIEARIAEPLSKAQQVAKD